MYVYKKDVEKRPLYWRFDGFSWNTLRSEYHPKKGEKQLRIKCDQLAHRGSLVDMKRYECHLIEGERKNDIGSYILVRYLGSFYMELCKKTVHGLRKQSPMKAKYRKEKELKKTHILGDTPVKQNKGKNDLHS